MVSFTDRPDMTLDVYRRRKTAPQQGNTYINSFYYYFINIIIKFGSFILTICTYVRLSDGREYSDKATYLPRLT